MPADYHMPPPGVEMVGRLSTGRFGWFIPKVLIQNGSFPTFIPYTTFNNNNAEEFDRFIFDESILNQL